MKGGIACQRTLLEPGGVSRAERVPIQMESNRIGGDDGGIAPRDGLATGQQARGRVEGHVDVVGDIPCRLGCGHAIVAQALQRHLGLGPGVIDGDDRQNGEAQGRGRPAESGGVRHDSHSNLPRGLLG